MVSSSDPAELSRAFPRAKLTEDGWSTEDEATATCFCGAVQLVFPTRGPGLVHRFLCHCADCRKISSSLFCANLTVADAHLRHVRGRDRLRAFGQAHTVRSGARMTNHFCDACGSLMYRVSSGFPGLSILRLGTVDDVVLAETRLRPQSELFVEARPRWLMPVEGARQFEGMPPKGRLPSSL